MRGSLIGNDLVIAGIVFGQQLDQQLAVGCTGRETPQCPIPRDPHLPQHQHCRGIDAPAVEHELTGLEMLATERAGVDAEIGVETVFGGNAGFHHGVESFGAGMLDRAMRHERENAGVAVEHRADTIAGPHLDQDRLDHFTVAVDSRLSSRAPVTVIRLEAPRIRPHLAQPELDQRVGNQCEHHIRTLDVAPRTGAEVRTQHHAQADTGKTSGPSHSSPRFQPSPQGL